MLSTGEIIIISLLVIIIIFIIISRPKNNDVKFSMLRQEITGLISNLQNVLTKTIDNQLTFSSTKEIEKIDLLIKTISDNLQNFKNSIDSNTKITEERLFAIKDTISSSVKSLEVENSKKLDEMRNVVDEKLQKTLDERLSNSFKMVNDRLKEVHLGLGEMQSLASGVGDLKKVLSNVKTRGILGESQLGNILKEILTYDQFEENIITKTGSSERVEFAIKFPGSNSKQIYLPIDAKFPLESYSSLLDSYDTGDATLVKTAKLNLISNIKKFAKTISDKYIDVPNTTDFAILYLPIEGLFAEVVKTGITEDLNRNYKIVVAGPTTITALLNSFRVGFNTIAIQKRSSEVWEVLNKVKNEFHEFEKVLTSTQNRLSQASDDLEKLVGVRTRKIKKSLTDIGDVANKIT
ncbi:MAG: DNA recombination protein RmuC [Bacilli bacterium]